LAKILTRALRRYGYLFSDTLTENLARGQTDVVPTALRSQGPPLSMSK
jgi:hypothetical protein